MPRSSTSNPSASTSGRPRRSRIAAPAHRLPASPPEPVRRPGVHVSQQARRSECLAAVNRLREEPIEGAEPRRVDLAPRGLWLRSVRPDQWPSRGQELATGGQGRRRMRTCRAVQGGSRQAGADWECCHDERSTGSGVRSRSVHGARMPPLSQERAALGPRRGPPLRIRPEHPRVATTGAGRFAWRGIRRLPSSLP